VLSLGEGMKENIEIYTGKEDHKQTNPRTKATRTKPKEDSDWRRKDGRTEEHLMAPQKYRFAAN